MSRGDLTLRAGVRVGNSGEVRERMRLVVGRIFEEEKGSGGQLQLSRIRGGLLEETEFQIPGR